MALEIEARESVGSAPARQGALIGTANQVEWAERIKRQVNTEFDRVAAAFRSVAGKQASAKLAATEVVLAILEEKRVETMSHRQAGHFIREWQEIGDQVRQLIFHDARYQAIQTSRAARPQKSKETNSIMNIRPLYDRIVVKRIEEQEAMHNGIVIPDSAKEKPQEGEVMAVGHGKRLESGELVALDVKVGDLILFGKYSGSETKLQGTEYIIMREDDVLGVLDRAPKTTKKTS